jgi:hypothetical protein
MKMFKMLKIVVFLGCMGDTQFNFRIRQSPGRKPGNRLFTAINKDLPVSFQV